MAFMYYNNEGMLHLTTKNKNAFGLLGTKLRLVVDAKAWLWLEDFYSQYQ